MKARSARPTNPGFPSSAAAITIMRDADRKDNEQGKGMDDDGDRRADRQRRVADAREKPRRVRRVVAAGTAPNLRSFALKAISAAPAPCGRRPLLFDGYTTGLAQGLCEGRHTWEAIVEWRFAGASGAGD